MISQGKLVEDILAVLDQRHNVTAVTGPQFDAVIDAANILVRAFALPEETKLSKSSLGPVNPFPVQ